jgi:hypothetical protein
MTTGHQCKWAKKQPLLCLVFCLLIAGCGSSGGGGGQSTGSQVYAVGSAVTDATTGLNVPVYWHNSITELSRIDSTCDGYANSIIVTGQDTHIAGSTFVCSDDGTVKIPVAAYWKNGVRTDLERPAAHAQEASEAQQVFLANGSIYIAGYVTGDQGPLPVYWRDGRIVYLTAIPYGGTKARASNLYIDGTDVYVSGAALFDTAYPAYWKNGEVFTLPIPTGFRGTSVPLPIHVENGDVYIFGHLHRLRTPTDADTSERPVYWKNGTLVPLFPLTNGAGYSYGGTVFNGAPYSAGAYVEGALYTPSVWADQTRQRLPMIDENLYGMAHDVFVDGGGIYVAGWTYESTNPTDPEALLKAHPCYWINGARVDLPALQAGSSAYAREIYVTR